MQFDYDLCVIGAGSGGLAASKRSASYGARVAIIEGDLVGGTCVIRGCVPKKLMVYASQFAHLYKSAEGYGWSKVEPVFDWQKLQDAVQQEVHRLSALHISLLEKAGVELISGWATFVDDHTLQVGDRRITAQTILIAVGGEARKTDHLGMEYAITSREMFHLERFPQRFGVIGGGYIGVEFAGIMHGLGAQVTQIIRDRMVLRGFDEEIRAQVQEGMITKGIEVVAGVKSPTMVLRKTDMGIQVQVDDQDNQTRTWEFDVVLAATGRKPNLAPLNLHKAGVEVAGGAIVVKPDSSTSNPHIYAVGDCTDRVNLTPVAIAEGRAFADTVFGHMPRYISHKQIPSAVFSQPEVGTVGMTEAEAISQYGSQAVKVYRSQFRPMFYSLTGGTDKTFMKLIVVGEKEHIVGMHMTGKDSAEIIQGMAVVVNMGGTKADLDRTIGIHPSTAEEFVTMR
jgi:glutathione reductase (NADPH)